MRPSSQPANSTVIPGKFRGICRLCGHSLTPVINFGKMPLANAFVNPDQFSKEYFFNLAAGLCEYCLMFQLVEQPEPAQMFHSHYPFFTGSSLRMRQHFAQLADNLKKGFISPGGFILEIGSNDGTFLENFPVSQYQCLGVEPSANTAARAREKGIAVADLFFNAESAIQIQETHGHADVILATNCLCHIPDPASVFTGIDFLLKDKGIAVFEDPYLGDVLAKTAYDQIYDEHVFLFSVISMSKMVDRYDFEIFDLEPQWTHGGSMRYFIARKGNRPVSAKVTDLLEKEKNLGLETLRPYEIFNQGCETSKEHLTKILSDFKSKNVSVAGYAATSKSTTVLNYCGIGPELISFISDTTPEKQGKFTPGMHIPVVSYDVFKQKPPKAAVLFAWNHAQEIMEKENVFRKEGGKWIHFVPEVKVE